MTPPSCPFLHLTSLHCEGPCFSRLPKCLKSSALSPLACSPLAPLPLPFALCLRALAHPYPCLPTCNSCWPLPPLARRYIAPELLMSCRASKAADVYSFGVREEGGVVGRLGSSQMRNVPPLKAFFKRPQWVGSRGVGARGRSVANISPTFAAPL